jgi:biotin carboxyl carrier protein
VLESMKMQNELRSPRPGRVAHLRVSAGQTVEQDQTLLIIE